MNTQTYTVNIRTGVVNITRVDVSQGDTGRTLAFSLYDGLSPFTPPTGSTVTIVGRKPSGLGFSETCTVSGNTAAVNTTLAMTQEAGKFPVELRIESDTRSVGTANFVMHVEPSPHPAGTTDGTTEEARTVLEQCEEYAQIAQEAAEAASGDYTEIRADVDDLDDRVEALEGGAGGGLTADIKSALLALFQHVAYADDDGQDYYDALYDALYPPAPPASLTSITAVYTQSGTVYDTDTLNDLKSDLVVTAHYSDSTSHAVTDYTLSGTLAVGTSVIAANYNGKSTTFTVTVTQGPLYPLENGSHTFSTNSRTLTVSRGNHFAYTAPNATSSTTAKGAYVNLSTVSDNNSDATTMDNVNALTTPLFTIPSGASIVFEIKNITFTNVGTAGTSNKYAFACRNDSGSGLSPTGISTGDKHIADTSDITVTKTAESDIPVTCVFMYISNPFSAFSADVSLTVNGVRWI